MRYVKDAIEWHEVCIYVKDAIEWHEVCIYVKDAIEWIDFGRQMLAPVLPLLKPATATCYSN